MQVGLIESPKVQLSDGKVDVTFKSAIKDLKYGAMELSNKKKL